MIWNKLLFFSFFPELILRVCSLLFHHVVRDVDEAWTIYTLEQFFSFCHTFLTPPALDDFTPRQHQRRDTWWGSVWWMGGFITSIRGLSLGFPYGPKRLVNYWYLSKVYRGILSFLGPQGSLGYHSSIWLGESCRKHWRALNTNERLYSFSLTT